MISQNDLAAYLDEALPAARMAEIEDMIRQRPELTEQLAEVIARRDAGMHSLGDVWRRHRLSCPAREQLGSHLLGILSDEENAYVAFHLSTIGCRFCQANLDDLKQQQAQATAEAENAAKRRRKYFQSSAGHLRPAKR